MGVQPTTFRTAVTDDNKVCWYVQYIVCLRHKVCTIRRLLPLDILKTLHAFVSCRLDYCNSLFAGLPACDIAQLQYVQNAGTSFGGISKFESIQSVLHWLQVGERITFKMALLMYEALHGLTPSYLTDML